MKKAYIVTTHSYTPNLMAREAKDYWRANETCEFVTNLTKRHLTRASVILDYTAKKVYKTRAPSITFDSYVEYLDKEYKTKMQQLRYLVDGVVPAEFKSAEEFKDHVVDEIIGEMTEAISEMTSEVEPVLSTVDEESKNEDRSNETKEAGNAD